MRDGLTNPSQYFAHLLVCWSDGTWEKYPTSYRQPRQLYQADLVIGIYDGGQCRILKNRYGYVS